MSNVADDLSDVFEFPLRTIDEIWEQWNQSNELSSGTNLPSTIRSRQQDNAVAAVTEVFDSEFRYLYEIPTPLVKHLPSARLNITRLVICRNYRNREPDSCVMGENCKFVHADVDLRTLEAHPIHVNYIWRHEDLCTYDRLPPGELVEVLSTDNRTIESIPSERILVTRGANARHDMAEPLIRCKYYDASQTCYTGDRCNFVHIIFVDPNVLGIFKRAPKAHVETSSTTSAPASSANNPNSNTSNTGSVPAAVGCVAGALGHSALAANPDGSAAPVASKWVPNIASPSFDPAAMGGSFAPLSALHYHPSLPAFAAPSPSLPAPDPFAGVDAHAMELLRALSPQNPADGAGGGQEQLVGVLAQVVSLLRQRIASPRTITVAPSTWMEEGSGIGTLLFLPRGGAEAAALLPVQDRSVLHLLTAIATPGNGGRANVKSWYPLSTGQSPAPVGGGHNNEGYTKELIQQLQSAMMGWGGGFAK